MFKDSQQLSERSLTINSWKLSSSLIETVNINQARFGKQKQWRIKITYFYFVLRLLSGSDY